MKLNDIMYNADDLTECIESFLHAFFHNQHAAYMEGEELRGYIKNWVEVRWEPVRFKRGDE